VVWSAMGQTDTSINLARVGSRSPRKRWRRSTTSFGYRPSVPKGRHRKAGREELNHERPERPHQVGLASSASQETMPRIWAAHAAQGEQPSLDVIGRFCVRPDESDGCPGDPGLRREPTAWRHEMGDDVPAGSHPASHVTDWMTVITNPGRALASALTARCPTLALCEKVRRVIQTPVPGSVLQVEGP